MVLSEHSDFVKWGLRLFDGDPSYSPGYYGDIIQHDAGDVYNGPYFHGQYDAECNHVENDEIIARTLQEEFSQLNIAERSRYSQEGEEQFHAPEPAYGWRNSSMMNHCSEGIRKDAASLVMQGLFDYQESANLIRKFSHAGHDYAQEEAVDAEPSSSCSSPCEGGGYSVELTDDYPLDDEVGRKLSQMIPIPHVPRINGEIPSIDEVTSDHQRLLDRLQLYDFVENKVEGDGNCQFRALSDQLYGTPESHKLVRRQVVNQLKTHPEIYEGYVPMDYGDYLERMSENGEWGDHVTLQAAADSGTCCIEILPHFEKPKRVIFLSFWAEVHYNSIYPQGEVPSMESRKKKRWWNFGSNH